MLRSGVKPCPRLTTIGDGGGSFRVISATEKPAFHSAMIHHRKRLKDLSSQTNVCGMVPVCATDGRTDGRKRASSRRTKGERENADARGREQNARSASAARALLWHGVVPRPPHPLSPPHPCHRNRALSLAPPRRGRGAWRRGARGESTRGWVLLCRASPARAPRAPASRAWRRARARTERVAATARIALLMSYILAYFVCVCKNRMGTKTKHPVH